MSTTHTEEFSLNSDMLLQKVKEIIKQGNVRKIIIKDKNGKSIAEFPLTIGVVGAVAAPVLAAIGVIAALITECTLVVERQDI